MYGPEPPQKPATGSWAVVVAAACNRTSKAVVKSKSQHAPRPGRAFSSSSRPPPPILRRSSWLCSGNLWSRCGATTRN